MNKFIALMIAGAMCTFTVNAADFAVTGDVGLTSQNMYRG